jgi:hypothetical protein
MAYSIPQSDFITTSLSGDITAVADSMTIGAGLDLPATNGILQINYDSTKAVGASDGPETITYAAYVTGSGAVTGMTRGAAGTTGVAHTTGASVQSGMSVEYLKQSPLYDTWNAAGTLTYAAADSPTFTATVAGDSTTSIYPGVRLKAEQTQALSHYWTFNTNSAADVGAATMADIGTPTYAAGKFSNALTLNGTNQALSITDAAGFKPTGEFTMGVWVKFSDAANFNTIFQSWSKNANSAGFYLMTNQTTGMLIATFGNNTGAATASTFNGTINVSDNAYHYIVMTFRNNYLQVYVDGKLDISGYCMTPAYAATNYVRIGVRNDTGASIASTWAKGQIDDLFLINGYALDEQTIAAKYAAATAQGTGDLTLTKYFLCTASSYSAPNTTVTLYGGTDHSLANATISNAYYSTQKAPYGFPLNPAKWTVYGNSVFDDNTGGPAQGTWYNQGTSAVIPLGYWNLQYSASFQMSNASAIAMFGSVTLSPTASAKTDDSMTVAVASGNVTTARYAVTANKDVYLPVKKTFYINYRTESASVANLYLLGTQQPSTIRATSTLL